MTTDWRARAYQPGDEHGLVQLYARIFGRERAVEAWRWKLLSRRREHETVWVAESRDGELIGQYAGIPLDVRLDGEVRRCVNAVEAMTHPDHRRQGILTTLASTAHATWRSAGVAAVIGLPNDQWRGPQRVLRYTPVTALRWLRFPLHLGRVLARHPRVPVVARPAARSAGALASSLWRLHVARPPVRASVAALSPSGAEIDEIWDRVGGGYSNAVVRDAAWVTWRYRQPRHLAYRVLVAARGTTHTGYVAFRVTAGPRHRTGYIADLLTAPDDPGAARALLRAALAELGAAEAATVVTTAAPGTALHRHLRRAGFLAMDAAFSFDVVRLDPALRVSRRGWQLTAGDLDIDLEASPPASDPPVELRR